MTNGTASAIQERVGSAEYRQAHYGGMRATGFGAQAPSVFDKELTISRYGRVCGGDIGGGSQLREP
jgi:hypothetical protein